MLQESTLQFLSRLKKNNNKVWMDDHRKEYEQSKKDFLSYTEKILEKLIQFDKSLSGIDAKDCIFRINRDIRFSKDKRPYKNNFAAFFSKGGKKGPWAGYYLHVEPGNLFMAGGIWMPEPKVLASIRQEIDYNREEWTGILKSASFKKYFNSALDTSQQLSRPPKGFEADNPVIDHIKLKSFICTRDIEKSEITGNESINLLTKAFSASKPLIDFINRCFD